MKQFECWRVAFDRFSYDPLVIVEIGTAIEFIEQMGREVMGQRFGDVDVRNLNLEKIERLRSVYANV